MGCEGGCSNGSQVCTFCALELLGGWRTRLLHGGSGRGSSDACGILTLQFPCGFCLCVSTLRGSGSDVSEGVVKGSLSWLVCSDCAKMMLFCERLALELLAG